MDQIKVTPLLAAVVIGFSVLLFGLKFWADGEAFGTDAPTNVVVTPGGDLAVVVGHEMLVGTPDKLKATYDLSDFGAPFVLGDVRFFPNGDLLIRQGEDLRSFMHNLRAYGRDEHPDTPETGGDLVRCNLATQKCGSISPDLRFPDSPFWVEIDPKDETLFVSAPEQHRIFKYSASGKQLAVQDQGLAFPNQLLLRNGKLYNANTNYNEIAILDPATRGFGNKLKTVSVKGLVKSRTDIMGVIWTLGLAPVGDEWWVLVKGDGMVGGPIERFDQDWRFLSAIDLPQGSDTMALTPFKDRVVVADIGLRRVLQFRPDGAPLPDLAWPELTSRLTAAQERNAFYSMIGNNILFGFVLLFLGLLLWAQREKKRLAAEPAPPIPAVNEAVIQAEQEKIGVGFSRIYNRIMGLFLSLSFLGLSVFSAMSFDELGENALYWVLGTLLMSAIGFWMTFKGFDWLLSKQKKKQPAEVPAIDPQNGEIHWIRIEPWQTNLRYAVIFFLALSWMVVAGWTNWSSDKSPIGHKELPLLALALSSAVFAFHFFKTTLYRLGINKNQVIMLHSLGRVSTATFDQVILSDQAIRVGDGHIHLGLFPWQEVARYLMPKLARAKRVPHREMRKLWWRDNGVEMVLMLVLGLGGLVLFAVY